MKNFLEKHVKQYDIGIAVVMLLTFLCCMFQPMYAANRALTDQMWQQPEGTNAKIKIIKIDEKTLSELGQYNTWTREIPARLVEFENEAHQVFRPQNSLVWNREFFGWLDKYVK